MEIPARKYYRYLLLCGKQGIDIASQFDRDGLLTAADNNEYFESQWSWARGLLSGEDTDCLTAVKRAGMSAMLNAHKGSPSGQTYIRAYSILARDHYKRPIDALLLSGFEDWEVRDAVNSSLAHNIRLDTDTIKAYREYFFDPGILDNSSVAYLAICCPWIRPALMGLTEDLLTYALGLRYSKFEDDKSAAFTLGYKKWLLTLESLPLRTDREGIRALSTFLSAAKSLDRGIIEGSGDVPLFDLIKSAQNLEGIDGGSRSKQGREDGRPEEQC